MTPSPSSAPISAGEGTPAPSATRTHTRTPTASPSPTRILTYTRPPTRTPSFTPTWSGPIPFIIGDWYSSPATPTPIATPGDEASKYHLANWTQDTGLKIIQDLIRYSDENDYDWFGGDRPGFYDAQFPIKLALQEFLHRFPGSPYAEVARWRLAFTNAILGYSETDAWMAGALQNALNAGDVLLELEALNTWLDRYGFGISRPHAEWLFYDALNLFGDGRPAWVFRITTLERYSGPDGLTIAAEEKADGSFRLLPLLGDWDFLAGGDLEPVIGDHNRNGIPEVALYIGNFGSGMCFGDVYIFEWQEGRFVDLSRGQIGLRDCTSSWDYEAVDENGVETFAIRNFQRPQEIYQWSGEFYAWLEDRAPLFGDFQPDHNGLIWLANALEAGNYLTVTQTLEGYLQAAPEADSESEPSLPDYLRFELGLSYALQSNPQEAIRVMNGLVMSPTNPLTRTVSLAASQFLANYAGDQDIYRACQAAEYFMENTLAPYRDLEIGAFSNEDLIRVQGYTGPFELCPMDKAFQLLVAGWVPGQSGDFLAFLRRAGVSIAAEAQYDLDGDGDQDWVVGLEYPWDEDVDIWALVVDGSGITPLRILLYVTAPGSGLSQDYFKVETFQLPGNAVPITFLSAADELTVFQFVYNQARPPYLQRLESLNGVKNYSVQVSGEALEFKAYFTPDRWSPNWQVYRWDPAYYRFYPVKRDACEEQIKYYGPEDAAQAAEEKLLMEWDPAAAIPLLNDVLATPRGEQEGFWCYGSAYCLDRTRLYYLLALAYELTGNETSAVQTYWQLWHDYPASPYALMARAKLESELSARRTNQAYISAKK